MNPGSHPQVYFFDSSVKALVGRRWGVLGEGKTEKGGGGDLLTRSPVRAAAVQGHTVSPPRPVSKHLRLSWEAGRESRSGHGDL